MIRERLSHAVATVACLLPLVAAAPAGAAVTLNAVPSTSSPAVAVGEPVTITSSLTPDTSGEDEQYSVEGDQVLLTPSCGTPTLDTQIPCDNPDVGVFDYEANDQAHARQNCTVEDFIATADFVDGTRGLAHVGGLFWIPDELTCVIDLQTTALRLPTLDAGPSTPGLQTQIMLRAEVHSLRDTPIPPRYTDTGQTLVTVTPAGYALDGAATAGALPGEPISASATVVNGLDPTGDVTFVAFAPGDEDCGGEPAFATDPVPLAEASAASGEFVPEALGSYRWVVSYSGDGDDAATTTACGAPELTSVVAEEPPPDDPPGDGGPGDNGPGPGGTGGPSGGGTARDVLAPALGTPVLRPSRFRAARSGPSIAARVGTTVTYTLSEPATVVFTVERALPGRRAGRRCVAPRRSNRKRRACTRHVRMRGSFTHSGRAGRNRLRFSGRLRGRRLAPGRYRLVARATDTSKNASPLRQRAFRIVRR